MKVCVCVLIVLTVLAGCGTPVYETLGNVVHVGQQTVDLREVLLDFPEECSVITSLGSDVLYTCNGYTMSLQNLQSGDISATIRTLSGYDPAQLTVIESRCGDHKRYDWIWVAAGENGDALCRGAILDDGNYHYTLCTVADADAASQVNEAWNELFCSFCLDSQQET